MCDRMAEVTRYKRMDSERISLKFFICSDKLNMFPALLSDAVSRLLVPQDISH